LHPHSDGVPCDVSPPPANTFPPVCDAIVATANPNNSILIGARNLTIEQISAALIATVRLTRPVWDQTGLDGRFDFTLEWIRESNNPGPIDLQEGTTFQEALARATWIEAEIYKGNNRHSCYRPRRETFRELTRVHPSKSHSGWLRPASALSQTQP